MELQLNTSETYELFCGLKQLYELYDNIYVYSTRKRIDTLKDRLESSMPIRFIMNREHCRPVVIPEVVQAVQKILPKTLFTHCRFQILVGGGDDADIETPVCLVSDRA